MRSDCVAKLLEFAVDRLLSELRLEGPRVEKEVDVFRKPLNEIPALGEARAALEDRPVARSLGDDAQGFGDVVILLDNCRTQPLAGEMLRCPDDCLVEVGMVKKFHVRGASFACQLWARSNAAKMPKSNRESGFKLALSR